MVDAHNPVQGSAAARFQEWLEMRRYRVQDMLERLTRRWLPLASFVEVNFVHPEVGPAGALVATATTIDPGPLRHRAERLRVIPFRELAPYLPRWERGDTVLVSVDEMPPDLARRYAATPFRWSLNVPVRVEDTWVGLVGAVGDERRLSRPAISSFEAMAEVLMRDFAADTAWCSFRRSTAGGKRLLRLLR